MNHKTRNLQSLRAVILSDTLAELELTQGRPRDAATLAVRSVLAGHAVDATLAFFERPEDVAANKGYAAELAGQPNAIFAAEESLHRRAAERGLTLPTLTDAHATAVARHVRVLKGRALPSRSNGADVGKQAAALLARNEPVGDTREDRLRAENWHAERRLAMFGDAFAQAQEQGKRRTTFGP